MKKNTSLTYAILFCAATLFLGSCNNKQKTGTWDDGKESTSYNQDGWAGEEDFRLTSGSSPFSDDEFLPLKDDDLKTLSFSEGAPQPRFSPGEAGSGIPGIQHFHNASGILTEVFRNVYFDTNDHMLHGKENLAILYKMATYLREHPNTYVYVEGHCDERGQEAYNLSLGMRRAQQVRSLLIQHGVDLNQIHTISYGKEKPVAFGHTAQDWAQNRRAHFIIYEKN